DLIRSTQGWPAGGRGGRPPAGRRQEATRVYGATWDEVAKKRADLLANDRQGIPAEIGDKVREYLEYWLSMARLEPRPRTYETYQLCVHRHFVPVLGGRRLHSLTPAGVRSLMVRKLGEGLEPRTVQCIRAVLRSASAQAVRHGLLEGTVAARVRPPRAPRHEVASLSFEEVVGVESPV